MPGQQVLCVAEKPAIAKAVAGHLSGGSFTTRNIQGNQYVKNYQFTYDFPAWGNCDVTMTSVIGHLTGLDFPQQFRGWTSTPPANLFDAPVEVKVDPDKVPIANNLIQQARSAKILFIWTDCDREGEHIGTEVRSQAMKGNSRILVKRARFSNTERNHVIQAARSPIDIDERQANAVNARIELDLRIGAAFTRFLTLQLRTVTEKLQDQMLSYGSCQFPTLGFVVERYMRVRNFKPETFWLIKVTHKRDGITCNFNWKRVHLFDRAVVTVLFEQCLDAKHAKVIRVQKKPTSKWRPLPLTTVELQMQGSRFLHMNSQEVMNIAEKLYQKGFISYPRTETDQFPKDVDLQAIVRKQVQHPQWGPYSQGLIDGEFRQPRSGRNNDQAHPPIHPVNFAAPSVLDDREKKVYEFVTRRFLACCSEDAKGEASDIDIEWGPELFHAHGLVVIQRNYLDIYVYDKWESSQQLPQFQLHETFQPTEANMTEGKTTSPSFLTEPELIGLMDANGIGKTCIPAFFNDLPRTGTDATMAEHIAKIKDRHYVQTRPKQGRPSIQEFIPTVLGVALIEGYDNLGLEISLSKPHLRKQMEVDMKAICEGRKARTDVVNTSLEQYREVFIRSQQGLDVLKRAVIRYIVNNDHR